MTVTYTVGTSGRNYSTWAAAIAAIPANISSSGTNTPYVLEAYNDSEFYSTSGNVLALGAITTDSTNTITLTAAPGQSFMDNVNAQTNALCYNQANGVGLHTNLGYGTCASTVGTPNVIISRLQFYLQGYSSGSALDTDQNSSVSDCIIQMTDSSGGAALSPGGYTTFTNCAVIVGTATTSGVSVSYDTVTFVNCTIACPSDASSSATGIFGYSATFNLINCAIFGFGTNYGGTSTTWSGSNNASDQAIGFGTSNQASKTYASQFVGTTTATMDFRTKTGAALIGNGVVETTYIPSATDILGTARGSTWSIGAHQIPAATGDSGTIADTEANDVSSAAGTVSATGTINDTEANDIASGAATVSDAGTIADTEANDTAAAAATPTDSGTITDTEANDIAAAAGTVTDPGTIGTTEANDVASMSGGTGAIGTISATEANDLASASGTVRDAGTFAETEANDTASSAGTVVDPGTIGTIEANDMAAMSGGSGNIGVIAQAEANDTASASGMVTDSGAISAIEANDTLYASGIVLDIGAIAEAEANDMAQIHGSVGLTTSLLPNPKFIYTGQRRTRVYIGQL